jgi:hypothetical protein
MGAPRMHACGACGARLFTARYRDSGILVHVEKADNTAGGPPLYVVPDLPGLADSSLPHVAVTTQRQTPFREHHCPKARAYSAASFRHKERGNA